MLQYRDNIEYLAEQRDTFFDDLEQLRQCIKHNSQQVIDLYEMIRKQVYKTIKIEQLAVTIILNDLHQLRKRRPQTADIIEYFIANNTSSYQEIANQFGCTKQNVHLIIKNYAKHYRWLNNLMQIKGQADAKNGNNRTVFYNDKGKGRNKQLRLF